MQKPTKETDLPSPTITYADTSSYTEASREGTPSADIMSSSKPHIKPRGM